MSVIVIEDWMIEEKGLSGLELLAFALIHGCTQKGDGCWYGGYDSLARRIGGKQRGTINAINYLVEIGAIERSDIIIDGKKRKALRSLFSSALNADAENADAENAELPLQKMQSELIIKEINNNKEKIISKDIIEKKPSRFVKPTAADVGQYCRDHGYEIDAQYFVDFYESKGWLVGKSPMKDWKAAVRTWVKNNKRSDTGLFNQQPQQQKNEPVYHSVQEWEAAQKSKK